MSTSTRRGSALPRRTSNEGEAMKRSLLYLLVAGVAVSGMVAATQQPAAPKIQKPLITVLYPKDGTTDGMLWPNRHSWIISVDRLDPSVKSTTRSLAVRAIHKKLGKGESPSYKPRNISKVVSQSSIRFGKLDGGNQAGPTVVCIQLINLNDAKIPLGPGKRPLRLLLTLQGGGGGMEQEHVIEGDYCGGSRINTAGKWKDGELHLMNFYAVSDDNVTTYDIVLLRPKDDEPTGR
jgi:hypothetical protein